MEVGTIPAHAEARCVAEKHWIAYHEYPPVKPVEGHKTRGYRRSNRSKRAIRSVINTYGNGWLDCWMVVKDCWMGVGRASERSYLRALRIAATFAAHARGSSDPRRRGLSGGDCSLPRHSLPGAIPNRGVPVATSARVAVRAGDASHHDGVRPIRVGIAPEGSRVPGTLPCELPGSSCGAGVRVLRHTGKHLGSRHHGSGPAVLIPLHCVGACTVLPDRRSRRAEAPGPCNRERIPRGRGRGLADPARFECGLQSCGLRTVWGWGAVPRQIQVARRLQSAAGSCRTAPC